MAQEDIIIDFKVDYSQLDSAIETLERTGAVDKQLAQDFKAANAELVKQGQLAKGSVSKIGELRDVFNQVKGAATKMGKSVETSFQDGVNDALEEAGVSAREFEASLKSATEKGLKPTQSLKQELKSLTLQIAEAKASGGPVDAAMITRAGQLKDAIADANAEISNAGSDTRGVDNVIGSIQALAGGFALAQGAAALFGEENEDLQKALLKVNAAMAISQGIQQVLNATQKEGALTKLADATATGLQTAAQRIYTFVTGQATVATTAFKVALAATGIGLAIILIVALVDAFKDTTDSVDDANAAIDRQKAALEGLNEVIERQTSRQEALAKLQGKAESELIRIRGRAINAQIDGIIAANDKLREQRDSVDATSKAWFALNEQIEANNVTIAGLNNQAVVASINLQKQLADEAKEAEDKRKEAAEKAATDAKKRREALLQSEIDVIKKRLIEVEKGGAEEIAIRQRLIIAEAALEIAQAEGNQAKINLIRAKSLDDRYQLQQGFIARTAAQDKEARDAILAELDAYINETNAKLNAQLQYEQSLLDARTGKTRRALQTVADDQGKSADQRIAAIGSLERYELSAIDKQIENVNKLLISQEEKNLKIAELEDKREQIIEGTEKKITEVTNQEEDKRQKKRAESIQKTVEIATQVAEVFAALNDLTSEQENARLGEQKSQLDALVEAGAITEKEALKRQQQLEAQEKLIKQRQAQRQKQEALFQALLAIPQSYLRGLSQGGLPLAILYGGIAAAQAAIIAARPIPKFFKGKKDNYAGLGMVGESGAELIQRGGRMYVANKPTITYLGETDEVFTPSETKRMLHDMEKPVMNTQHVQGQTFDYAKLAKAMGKGKDININIHKDYIEDAVGNALTKHFNQRYKF